MEGLACVWGSQEHIEWLVQKCRKQVIREPGKPAPLGNVMVRTAVVLGILVNNAGMPKSGI